MVYLKPSAVFKLKEDVDRFNRAGPRDVFYILFTVLGVTAIELNRI